MIIVEVLTKETLNAEPRVPNSSGIGSDADHHLRIALSTQAIFGRGDPIGELNVEVQTDAQ